MPDNLREHDRTSVVMPIRYSTVIVNFRELKKISESAVSVDLSNGGIGFLTDYQLEKGHVVKFEEEIATNSRKAKVAVVAWVKKADGEIDKYRVGLKFVTH
jgi:c-di-GMP-binding flagellar brake protein YcgR